MTKSTSKSPAITFDRVYKAMQDWRANKDQYDGHGIPDELWAMIFKLEGSEYSGSELRRLFKLNSEQYHRKRKQHFPNSAQEAKPDRDNGDNNITIKNDVSSTAFVEAIVDAPKMAEVPALSTGATTKETVKYLKSTATKLDDIVMPTTMIVEYIRPDGHRLKIHATNNTIEDIMRSFCQAPGGVAA